MAACANDKNTRPKIPPPQKQKNKKKFRSVNWKREKNPKLAETRVSATQHKNGPKPRLLSKLFHNLQV